MTKKYYLYCLLVTPCLSALIAFSSLPLLVSFLLGLITEIGLIIAGFNLGKRDNN